jgi:hypothetical protein
VAAIAERRTESAGQCRSARSRTIVLPLAALSAVLATAACGNSDRPELRIYDPTGRAKEEVTIADVVPSSARASRQPDGSAALSFSFTREGASKFHRLTRSLARRGAEVHRPQRVAIEINGRRHTNVVDYRAFPNGLDGSAGVQLAMLRLPDAQRLAADIRG